VRAAHTALDANGVAEAARLAAAARELAGALGLALAGAAGGVPADVVELVTRRDEARAGRDFAGADALRDRLDRLGWVVEDTPRGSRVHRKDT
jgi:cysteinyl-tRNA synthetase